MPAPDPLQIDIGRMRNRVKVQQQSAPTDSFADPQGKWTTVRETWAGIDTASTREVYLTNQYTSQVTHIVWMRWSPIPLRAGMLVLFGTRVFTVQATENVRERNVRVNLLCVEIDGVTT